MVGKIIFLVLVPILTVFLLMSSPTTPWWGNGEDIEYAPPEYSPPPPDYSNIPEPYYIEVPQQYGVDALREYLQHREWDREYEVGVFDCTEMSAFLERVLENEGFHTYIMGGYIDNDPHSWVKVEIDPESYVIVEATTLRIIPPNDVEYNKYCEEYQDETIYDAVRFIESPYDWWNETGGL